MQNRLHDTTIHQYMGCRSTSQHGIPTVCTMQIKQSEPELTMRTHQACNLYPKNNSAMIIRQAKFELTIGCQAGR